jgi:hypothetical protein
LHILLFAECAYHCKNRFWAVGRLLPSPPLPQRARKTTGPAAAAALIRPLRRRRAPPGTPSPWSSLPAVRNRARPDPNLLFVFGSESIYKCICMYFAYFDCFAKIIDMLVTCYKPFGTNNMYWMNLYGTCLCKFVTRLGASHAVAILCGIRLAGLYFTVLTF